MNCKFIGAEVPDPCPRKTDNDGCISCMDGIEERAAILQFGEGTGGSLERPTCATREEANRMAREQALAAMTGQRGLF